MIVILKMLNKNKHIYLKFSLLQTTTSLHILTLCISKQVTATDGDKDRQQNIVYFLTGQGIDPDNPSNSKFDINRTTGEIFVLKVSNLILVLKS